MSWARGGRSCSHASSGIGNSRNNQARRHESWSGGQWPDVGESTSQNRRQDSNYECCRPTTTKLTPNRKHKHYADDTRFAVFDNPDQTGTAPCRQYICDSCRALCAFRLRGCPGFDGQYLYLEQDLDSGDPLRLKQAWLAGWDATWHCTACWCRASRKDSSPLQENNKKQMRLHMGIVTREELDNLDSGAPKYASRVGPRISVPAYWT